MVLPIPRTTTDMLLAAVHEELVGLRADLAASRDGEPLVPAEPVLLTEPKPARTSKAKPRT